jgi:hypothetical protein
MKARGYAASALVALCTLVSHSPDARAADRGRGDDVSYGRFDGDLAIAGSAGITVGPRAPRATVDARFRYLSTAGLFATYEDASILFAKSEPRRALAFGIELRPLFLGRWATGHELGISRLDLLIDSFALELGAVFMQPDKARFGATPGLQAGIGFELPFFSTARGPMLGLHGGVRWSDAALSGGPVEGPSDRAMYLTLTVGWQHLFGGSVVDLGDRKKTARR